MGWANCGTDSEGADMSEAHWGLILQTFVILFGLGVAWNRISVKLGRVCERLDSHSRSAKVTRETQRDAHKECRTERIAKESEHSKLIRDMGNLVAAIEARGE